MKKLYKETTVDISSVTGFIWCSKWDYIQVVIEDNLIITEHIDKPYDKLTPIEAINDVDAYEHIKMPDNKLILIDEPLIKEPQPTPPVKESIPTTSIDKTKIKITKEELVQLIYNNFFNIINREIDLSDLDFSRFECDIRLDKLKVGGSLYQNEQEIISNLHQEYQKIGFNLFQSYQNVKGNLWQMHQVVGNNLYQNKQKVGGNIIQDEKED